MMYRVEEVRAKVDMQTKWREREKERTSPVNPTNSAALA